MQDNKITKWKSKAEYIDKHTREIISKKKAKINYIVTNKIKRYEINNDEGTIIWTYECQRAGKQLTIW